MAEGYDLSFVNLGITIEHLNNSISIFGFRIAYYGIIIGTGMLAGIWLAQADAKRRGQNPEDYLDFALYFHYWSKTVLRDFPVGRLQG